MPDNPNKLSQFWQELKRRKVVRVITVYAAASFVILELVSIIVEPLRLPEWTLPMIIVLICIGFIIAVILSWIYDIHPEGGIIKTEQADKVKTDEIPSSSNSWRIASYISFVVIVALIVLNIIPRSNLSNKKEILDKSIAVLPFTYLSDEPDKQYLADGTMDEIILNLSKIKDLRVLSKTSVEQYRKTDKSVSEICDELDVAFLLEGSFQKNSNQVRLMVQLIQPGKEEHAWSKKYDRNWQDIFIVQSEVAQLVANELQAVITPEEKKQIDEIPTEDLNAYEYYLLGRNRLNYHAVDSDFWRAIDYFQQAINIDPAFALAYSALADTYYKLTFFALRSPREVYPKVSEYSQKALELNEELAYTHCLLGLVKQSYEYDYSGAEKEYMRALEIDPKSVEAHTYYAGLHSMLGRTDEAIVHIDRAVELDPHLFSTKLIKCILLFNADSINEAIRLLEELRNSYPYIPTTYWISAVFNTHLGRYEEALSMLDTQLSLMGDDNISDEIGLQGFIYGQLNQKDEALKQQARLDELSLKGYYIAPRTRVWIYLGLDNLDEAFAVLEKAYINHSIDPASLMLYFYPNESLQSDPRFKDYLQKIGLNN
jgi:adenylate cyclase